jgi:excinuclease ABC subunit B
MPDLEKYIKPQDLPRIIGELEREMKDAADNLEFEVAAVIRDKIEALKMN